MSSAEIAIIRSEDNQSFVLYAGIFNGLGSKVTQLYRGPMFLRGFDADIRAHAAQEIRKTGVDLRFETNVEAIDKHGSSYRLLLNDGSFPEADAPTGCELRRRFETPPSARSATSQKRTRASSNSSRCGASSERKLSSPSDPKRWSSVAIRLRAFAAFTVFRTLQKHKAQLDVVLMTERSLRYTFVIALSFSNLEMLQLLPWDELDFEDEVSQLVSEASEATLEPTRRVVRYALPSGNSIDVFCSDSLRCAESLFQPSLIGKEETTIVTDGKQAEAMEKRIQQIRTEAENTDSQFDKEKAEERVAALGGGIARIKVGAATETELKDKKLRYEDALNAVKSALKTGILPGGGSTLAYLLRFEDEICNAIEDEDEKRGAKIVFNSLSAPVCQIAKNCGIEGQIVLSKVIDKDFGYGFNAANFEYGDLFDAGVVDSAQVTLSALENSASIAGLVLTTEALIHEIPQDLSEDEKLAAMDAAAGMGGMDYM